MDITGNGGIGASYQGSRGGLAMPTIKEGDEKASDLSGSSNTSFMSHDTGVTLQNMAGRDEGLTVDRKWKVDEELNERMNNLGGPSKIIPIAKWTATIFLGTAILCLFVATKASFITLSIAMETKYPREEISEETLFEWTQYTGQYLVIVLVILIPYTLLFLRAAWMGLCTRQVPWPQKSAVLSCVLVGVLEPLGLVILALKVLNNYSPSLSALIMSTVITLSVLISTYRSFRDDDISGVKVTMVVALVFILGGFGATLYIVYRQDHLTKDVWHLAVCIISLNVAWLPWLQKHMNQSETVITERVETRQQISSSLSTLGTAADNGSISSSIMSSAAGSVRMSNHASNYGRYDPMSTRFFKKATWKSSFILYGVKILATVFFAFVLFYLDTEHSVAKRFSKDSRQAFLDAWDFAKSIDVSYTWTTFAVNLIGALCCYVMVFVATHTNMQRGCFGIPLVLSLPMTITVFNVDTICSDFIGLDDVCTKDSGDWYYLVIATALFTIGQTVSFGRYAFRKERRFLLKEGELFWIPGYNGAILDEWLLLDRRQTIKEGRESKRAKSKSARTRVYICTTMYRESEDEMRQLLESLGKINEAQAEGGTFFESHVIFDGGVSQKKLSSFSLLLISLLEDTLGVHPATCTKIITPYGMKLSWGLPTQRGNSMMTFNIHLKDTSLVKNKKRWSQVMYMSYVLDFLNDAAAADEEPYILTTDADVRFTPDSVEALLDLMQRDTSIGAVCARTHPLGTGPLVWYQTFEYAVGHWFQKAAEHVVGSVLCSPGCFSVYRCKALRDILPKYSKKVESAFDFLTKDMGEDRWLCTLMVQSGWRIEYCAASYNKTNCPSEFEEFYKQRRRWIASTLANLMLIIKEWKYIALFNHRISVVFLFYQVLLLFSTLIAPSTVVLVVSGGLTFAWGIDTFATVVLQLVASVLYAAVCIFMSSKSQMLMAKIYTFLYAMVMCAVGVGTVEQIVSDLAPPVSGPVTNDSVSTISPPNQHISLDIPISVTTIYLAFLVGIFLIAGLLHPKEIGCLLHGVWYLLCLPSAYLVLMIYSICNLTDSSWGESRTREVEALSNTVKKESWHDLYKKGFYYIFFCCAPVEDRSRRGTDAEAQTVSPYGRSSSMLAHSDGPSGAGPQDEAGSRTDIDDLQASGEHQAPSQQESQQEHLEIEVEDVPVPVEEWLPLEFRYKYADIFKKYGFDNTMFIRGLTEKELQRMGIIKRGHVQYLMAEISMLPAFEIEYKVPISQTNVKDWLQEIGLIMYWNNFRRNHIRTPKEMEILKRFDRKDIEKELGITKEGHIKRLMYAIRMLRDPSEAQQKAIRMRQAIDETPVHYLKEFNVAEYDFWNRLKEVCLQPDLKAFGMEAEISDKLVQLRNNWLLILAVANTLWLILISTLATKGDLTLLGANPIGLAFLFIFGLLFIIQFFAMLVHRLYTLSHFLARASYKFGKPLQTTWSFKDKPESLEDTEDINAIRQIKYDAERALKRATQTSKRRVTERSALLSSGSTSYS